MSIRPHWRADNQLLALVNGKSAQSLRRNIYFLGTSPGRYQPIIPTFVVGWHPEHLRVQLAFGALVGASAQAVPPDAPEQRYALRELKARLHQASFREAVLAAHGGVRSPICPSRGCSMPPNSSWMRTRMAYG